MPHINKYIDFTVEVFIVCGRKVLLRKHDKYKIWLSVGGHIEPDEDPNQAAIREVKEEVGLDITLDNQNQLYILSTPTVKELIPPYFLNRNRITNTHEHVTFTYFALSKTDKILQNKEKEISRECAWFTKEELEDNNTILSNVSFYAQKALEILTQK